MRLIAIAAILGQELNIVTGFRLLDRYTEEIQDIQEYKLKEEMRINPLLVENLEFKGNIVGVNGSIDRLPKIRNGNIFGESPLIILNQIENTGYTVSDYKGQIVKLTTEDTIKYAKNHGIANGKIVKRGDKEFISAISGEYITIKNGEEVIKSTRAIKAKVFDPMYKEIITADGTLRYLVSGMNTVRIPKEVRKIDDGAIRLNSYNTVLVFGEDIQKCADTAIVNKSRTLKTVEIYSKGNGINEIIIALAHANTNMLQELELQFKNDITPETYYTVITTIGPNTKIVSDDCSKGDFMYQVMRLLIKNKVRVIRSESDRQEMAEYIKEIWKTNFRNIASKVSRDKVENELKDLDIEMMK